MNYVCGFLFSTDKKSVALIQKLRPTWQLGYVNGIGGAVLPGESVYKAMQREFEEETGVNVYTWEQFCILEVDGNKIYFFRAFDNKIKDVKTMTDEAVKCFPVDKLKYLKPVPNLYWMIPMAVDHTVTSSRTYQKSNL